MTLHSGLLTSAILGAMLIAGPAVAQSTQATDKTSPAVMPDATPKGADPEASKRMPREGSDAATRPTDDRASSQPANQALAGMRASELIGTTVLNAQNEEIGDINDLLFSDDGRIDRVVVGVGGFLGLGERDVALGLSDIDLSRDGRTYRASISMTREQLQALPEWKAPESR